MNNITKSNGHLFSDVGIDSIGFHAPRHYVDIGEFAKKRNVDPNKYKKGLLLKEMRMPQTGEDIVSLGLKAGYNALIRGNISPKDIDAVFVGTETMTYAVKSVSNIFAEWLGISTNSMTQDVYNACAAGTLAILNAIGLIEKEVLKKVLVIGADISSYNIGSPSECTQGSGAVALVISKNPRIATFSKSFGKVSGNINDFFRLPEDKDAQVFGHYSVNTYLNFQLKAYDDLIKKIGNVYADFYAFHAPFSKLPLKCIQHIIEKRWIHDMNNLLLVEKDHIKSSIINKIDSFLKNLIVVPEYLYLKLKELGFVSEKLEKMSHWLVTNIKRRVLQSIKVPMHFGNMYSASVWAQIIHILEQYARVHDTLYFGSYGSGATCISGLLKVQPEFKRVIEMGPKIDDFINNKVRMSVHDYELIKKGLVKPITYIGKIEEHEQNDNRGFKLYYCDNGCIIPGVKGLNYCPKGHPGFHEKFFPYYATLKTNPKMTHTRDLSFLNDDLVRIAPGAHKGNILEYEIRRIEVKSIEINTAVGLLDWSPMYVPVQAIF